MKLKQVREGEIFHFSKFGHGFSTDTALLCGQHQRTGLVRVYGNIASKSGAYNLWENEDVEVIGRLYAKPIKKR